MASSSKIRFRLPALREKALDAIDREIGEKQLDLDRVSDEVQYAQELVEWRNTQEIRLGEMVAALEFVSDADLEAFRVHPMPKLDEHLAARTRRELDRLTQQRESMLVKIDSLVADADGNVALTRTQLSDFFGIK